MRAIFFCGSDQKDSNNRDSSHMIVYLSERMYRFINVPKSVLHCNKLALNEKTNVSTWYSLIALSPPSNMVYRTIAYYQPSYCYFEEHSATAIVL